jgi:pyruvate kinase
MSLYWGITPFYFQENENDITQIQDQMIDVLKVKKLVFNGDKIVITHGDGKFFRQGTSNSLRVDIIKDLPREDLENKSTNKFQNVEIPSGRILLDTSLCASCQNCVNVCPHGIWKVSQDADKNTRIDVNTASNCSKDMECVEQCPTGAIEIIDSHQ